MRIAPRSLKGTLLLVLTSWVLVTCLLVALLASLRYSEALTTNLRAQARNQAHSLALQIADPILINDLVGVQKALSNHVQSHSLVEYAFVVRGEEVLAHTMEDGVPQGLVDANQPRGSREPSTRRVVSAAGDRDLLDIAQPVFQGKAGTLRLGLKRQALLAKMHQMWGEIGLLALAILLPAIIGGVIFLRRTFTPLESLVAATRSMEGGDLDTRVRLRGKEEFASLGEAFNSMAQRLQDYSLQLQQQRDNLERMHHQLSVAYEVIRAVSAQTGLDSISSHLLDKLREILPCARMTLLLRSRDRNRLYRLTPEGAEILRDQELVARMESRLEGLPSLQLHKSRIFGPPLVDASFSRSFTQGIIPMEHGEDVLGVLVIACSEECGCDFREVDLVGLIIAHSSDSIFRAAAQEEEMEDLRSRLEGDPAYGLVVGRDTKMQKVYSLIEEVAPTDATVLIHGESGTGKELAARTIHDKSPRRENPFVVIDCSSFPETLIESELFGHEKGAFTGADSAKPGRFEQAHGGTVFLDEVGDIPMAVQVKLLRVLQSQKFERLGGRRTISVDMRVIAATNKDLLQEVRAGRFREDLYYRLEVVPLELPPLRKRGNDIALLARRFADYYAASRNRKGLEISSQAMRLLLGYSWPGNVRELENTMEQAAIMARGDTIVPADLPEKIHLSLQQQEQVEDRNIRSQERELLLQTLKECAWNKKQAAQRLGIGRSTLYNKLKKYGLEN
ncbi:MAG: sigma 54-interacting transcriptional regulator [Desulfohalobiaceae bacterium]